MTYETYDDLSLFAGKKMSNRMWVELISEEFNVSHSVAKDMLHAMIVTKDIKTSSRYRFDER